MSSQSTVVKKCVRLEETYEGLTSKKLQKEFLQVKLTLIQTSKPPIAQIIAEHSLYAFLNNNNIVSALMALLVVEWDSTEMRFSRA